MFFAGVNLVHCSSSFPYVLLLFGLSVWMCFWTSIAAYLMRRAGTSHLQQKVQGSHCCRTVGCFLWRMSTPDIEPLDMYWAPLTGSLTGAPGGVVSKIDFVIKPNDARRRFVPVSSIDVKLNKFWVPMTSVTKNIIRGRFCDECQWRQADFVRNANDIRHKNPSGVVW